MYTFSMSVLKNRFYWKQLNTDVCVLFLYLKRSTVTWYDYKNDILIGTVRPML